MSGAIFLVALQILLFGLLVSSAYTDIVRRKVYDWATLPALVFGVALNWAAEGQPGAIGLESSMLGLAVGFGVFFIAFLFVQGGVGGGDVKLMGAIGAIGGWPFIVGAMFWSALFGAIIALGAAAAHGRLWASVRGSFRLMFRLTVTSEAGAGPLPSRRTPDEEAADPAQVSIPYGFAIAAGTMIYWSFAQLGGLAW